jgi:hypothetical protein
MDAVSASGFERRDPPCNRLLHGWSAGDAASNLVRELLQVGFQIGRLLGLGHHAIGCVLGEGGAEQNWEQRKIEPGLSHPAH